MENGLEKDLRIKVIKCLKTIGSKLIEVPYEDAHSFNYHEMNKDLRFSVTQIDEDPH